jgi:thiamine-monophosphate kinase
MGELELIEGIRSGWAGSARGVALGIGDDCAILRPPRGHEILVTTDFTLEGRHFRRDWHPAESVGHRALARGLSDLAAMGARPLAAFLSLALPAEQLATRSGRVWVERFFNGLRSLAELHHVSLAGGDTAQAPGEQILADIVLVGTAPAGLALRRSTAHAGDALYVTGQLGGAAAELAAMQARAEEVRAAESIPKSPGAPSIPRSLRKGRGASPELLAAHPQMFPQPRLAVGQALLRRRLACSAIDLSDGLSTDLAHLCQESGVGAEVTAFALPIHPLAAQSSDEQALKLALNGGEDYELLFAAPPAVRVPRSIAGVRVTRIGSLLRDKTISLVDSAGRRTPLKPGGWEHFSAKS